MGGRGRRPEGEVAGPGLGSSPSRGAGGFQVVLSLLHLLVATQPPRPRPPPPPPCRTRPLAAAGDADGTSCRPRPTLRHPRLPRARLPSPQPRPPAAGATAATKAAPRASQPRRLPPWPVPAPRTRRWRKYLTMHLLESKKKSKNQIPPMKKKW